MLPSTANPYCPPYRTHTGGVYDAPSLGKLFRDYGEKYIDLYKPGKRKIKLIRAIRVCKTPALGGKKITCLDCGHQHYIYFSCGHSHCPLCQSIKREQWIDKLRNRLLNVPYIHSVFTLPHQLNGLARQNDGQIYSLLMRTAWKTIKTLANIPSNLGALPGMIAVLHTFGSDLKYHVHVHCLVTFGGINDNGQWVYPKRKNKIVPYRQISRVFKEVFIQGVRQLFDQHVISYHQSFEELIEDVKKVRWCVFNTYPSMDTMVIEKYLSRYINRVAISPSRLLYLKEKAKTAILYNDYKNQKPGQPAPKALKHLHPLEAINQILLHVLPPYFQKCRRYGLHASQTEKRLAIPINQQISRNKYTIRTVFQIIKSILGLEEFECEKCHSINLTYDQIKPNKQWIFDYIQIPTTRPPPYPRFSYE